MNEIFIAILLLIAGASFLGWGIFQLKTGKMVARVKQPTIDEPRQVGALFSVMGVLLALLATQVSVVRDKMTESFANILYIVALIIFLIFILYVIVYNFRNQRIFTIKKDKAITPLTKKYYKPFSIALLLNAIIMTFILVLRLFPIDRGNAERFIPVLIVCIVLSLISTIFIVFINLKISFTYKKSPKTLPKKKKATKKSPKK